MLKEGTQPQASAASSRKNSCNYHKILSGSQNILFAIFECSTKHVYFSAVSVLQNTRTSVWRRPLMHRSVTAPTEAVCIPLRPALPTLPKHDNLTTDKWGQDCSHEITTWRSRDWKEDKHWQKWPVHIMAALNVDLSYTLTCICKTLSSATI